jgi:hypothetical protein
MTLEQQIVLACQNAIKVVFNDPNQITVEQLGRIINATAELRGGYVGILMHFMDRERVPPDVVALMLRDMENARLDAHMEGEELGRMFAEKMMP